MVVHCMFKKWEHVYNNFIYGIITHLLSKHFSFLFDLKYIYA